MEIARYWRLNAQRYRLAGSLCPNCGQPTLAPRPVCPRCGAQLARLADGGSSEQPASLDIASIERHAKYQVNERLNG